MDHTRSGRGSFRHARAVAMRCIVLAVACTAWAPSARTYAGGTNEALRNAQRQAPPSDRPADAGNVSSAQTDQLFRSIVAPDGAEPERSESAPYDSLSTPIVAIDDRTRSPLALPHGPRRRPPGARHVILQTIRFQGATDPRQSDAFIDQPWYLLDRCVHARTPVRPVERVMGSALTVTRSGRSERIDAVPPPARGDEALARCVAATLATWRWPAAVNPSATFTLQFRIVPPPPTCTPSSRPSSLPRARLNGNSLSRCPEVPGPGYSLRP